MVSEVRKVTRGAVVDRLLEHVPMNHPAGFGCLCGMFLVDIEEWADHVAEEIDLSGE